jgi:HSP20 family protein
MNLVRFKPFRKDLFGFGDSLDRFFNRDWGWDRENEGNELCSSCYPVTDINEDKDSYNLRMEVPGLKKDEVKIEFHNNQIKVTGEKKRDEKKEEDNYYHVESYYGKFQRIFTLPNEIDEKKIKANLENGILKLTTEPKSSFSLSCDKVSQLL